MRIIILVITFFVLSSIISCKESKNNTTPGPVIYKKDTTALTTEQKKLKAPIINIIDTVRVPATILLVKDSALTSGAIAEKMAIIYAQTIPSLVKEKNIEITGAKMAWYKTSSSPFFFEAGFPINKAPKGKLPKHVSIKRLSADSIVIARFFGPYDLTYQAYDVLKEWLADNNKKRKSAPYEIYVGNPVDRNGKPTDPYKVRTDIIFPY